MSRIAGRIQRLEHRFGGCPTCARRPVVTVLECVGDDGAAHVRTHGNDAACPDCGQPAEIVRIRLNFDGRAFPDPNGERASAPGSLQWERDHAHRHQAEGPQQR